MPQKYVPIVLACLCAGTVSAASFDCSEARSSVEKRICADAELSTLDEHLGRYYAAARSALKHAASCLKNDQQAWLRQARNACDTDACLKTAYLERLSELDALQPGVTAVRHLQLPARAQLVWIIPPAQDQIAAPFNATAEPLQVTGSLVNEVESGNGYVLRERNGASYPLLMLMFIDGRSADVLPQLAEERDAIFRARGHAAVDEAGGKYFEPSRCVYLYRMPDRQ